MPHKKRHRINYSDLENDEEEEVTVVEVVVVEEDVVVTVLVVSAEDESDDTLVLTVFVIRVFPSGEMNEAVLLKLFFSTVSPTL